MEPIAAEIQHKGALGTDRQMRVGLAMARSDKIVCTTN